MHAKYVQALEDLRRRFAVPDRIEDLNAVLNGLYWSLRNQPYNYPSIPERRARRAMTRPYQGKSGTIPPLWILFTIIEDDKVVELLWIEMMKL
jgi:hypothetical protein